MKSLFSVNSPIVLCLSATLLALASDAQASKVGITLEYAPYTGRSALREFEARCRDQGLALTDRVEAAKRSLGLSGPEAGTVRTETIVHQHSREDDRHPGPGRRPGLGRRARRVYVPTGMECYAQIRTSSELVTIDEARTERVKVETREDQSTACRAMFNTINERVETVFARYVTGRKLLGKRYCRVDSVSLKRAELPSEPRD